VSCSHDTAAAFFLQGSGGIAQRVPDEVRVREPDQHAEDGGDPHGCRIGRQRTGAAIHALVGDEDAQHERERPDLGIADHAKHFGGPHGIRAGHEPDHQRGDRRDAQQRRADDMLALDAAPRDEHFRDRRREASDRAFHRTAPAFTIAPCRTRIRECAAWRARRLPAARRARARRRDRSVRRAALACSRDRFRSPTAHETRAGVDHVDDDLAALAPGADGDGPAFRLRRHAVLDRVLDQRDHHERRQRRVGDVRIDFRSEREPPSHADLLDAEVGLGQRDFARDRGVRLAHLRQRLGQVAQQVVEHRAAGGAVGLVEAAHVRERVEQEVRLDLRLKTQEPRLDGLLLERGPLAVEAAHFGLVLVLAPDVEIHHGEQRRENEVARPRGREHSRQARRIASDVAFVIPLGLESDQEHDADGTRDDGRADDDRVIPRAPAPHAVDGDEHGEHDEQADEKPGAGRRGDVDEPFADVLAQQARIDVAS
jgi:hypothetical protein